MASDSAAGVVVRRLVPAAIAAPLVLALLAPRIEAGAGRALLVVGTAAALVGLIAWTAAGLARTERTRPDAENAASAEQARAALQRSNDRLRALADVSGAFAMVAISYQPLLDQIARVIADIVGDGALVTLISEDGQQLRNAANAHRDPTLAIDYRDFLARRRVSTMTSSSISALVARTGQPQRADIEPADMVARSDEALRPIVERLNVHSFAVVPIRARQTVIGTLSLVRSRPGNGYTDDDLALMQDLADRAGLAIENARLDSQLVERVRARTAELQRTNEELEAFSYSAAHDLRAPLRAIGGYSAVLAEDHAGALDADGLQHLASIRNAARRMGRLIDDLLELSRVGRAELRRERVAVSELARTVIDRLRYAEPHRKVDVVVEEGLEAEADRQLLEIALTNLLSNAWKFTGKRDDARIEVAARAETPTTYLIRDNGAGFDAAYADKLFGVFQRLHTASEFEGTGLGLATVQRVIRHHGGRVWAEGQLGAGATFFFTLEASR
jgi:K+-sensing histidine kinase KdpD